MITIASFACANEEKELIFIYLFSCIQQIQWHFITYIGDGAKYKSFKRLLNYECDSYRFEISHFVYYFQFSLNAFI